MKKKYALVTVLGATAGAAGYFWGKNRKQSRIETKDKSNKRVLFLVNHEVVIYNFRLEIVERLLADGYEVHISTPSGERVDKLRDMGAVIHDINFDRHGTNPLDEVVIICEYMHLMKTLRPFIVFSFTIKPNIYGAIASRWNHIPFVANITGLGTAVENGGIKQMLTVLMYRFAFGTKHGKIQRVFFQNEENEKFFADNRIAMDVHGLLPGSGVNTERFPYREYNDCGDGRAGEPVRFAFISRIMVEKGIDQYLDVAEMVRTEYSATEFHIAGFFESEYDRNRFDRLCEAGTVIYDGNIEDVSNYMGSMHCIVHPTYYPEGLSNVLLEASSTGRPIITTDKVGCREVVDNGFNGYMVPCQNSEKLVEAIKKFLELSWKEKRIMGNAARDKAEREFNRQAVVEKYMNEVSLK